MTSADDSNAPWLVQQTDNYHVHVLPEVGTDEVQHDLDPDCVCGPNLEHFPREGQPDGWIVTHHSLDGREQRERAASEVTQTEETDRG